MKIAFVTQPWDIVVPDIGGSTSIPIITYQFARRLVPEHEHARVPTSRRLAIGGQGRFLRIRPGHEHQQIRPHFLEPVPEGLRCACGGNW